MLNRYAAEGRSTFGAEIRETFTVDGTRLRWQSRVDRGDQAIVPGTLFVPLEGTVAYTGELVRALLRRDGGSAPVLAGSKLVAEQVGKLVVEGPGGRVPLVLVALTGIDAFPWYLWHRDDSSKAFFAVAWPGFAIVPKGYEANADALVQAGLKAQDERLVALQKRLARPLPGLTVVRGVMWFDAPAAAMRGPSDIFIRAGRIAAITDAGALAAQADHVIEGRGRTLLPGLFDMHGHMWAGIAPLHLAAGVTSARELAGRTPKSCGCRPGSHRRTAGAHDVRRRLHRREESGFGPQRLRRRFGRGGQARDRLVRRAWLPADQALQLDQAGVGAAPGGACQGARNDGGRARSSVHEARAGRPRRQRRTHPINQVMLDFIGQPGDDTRTLLRFTRVGDDASRVDVEGPEVRAFIALLGERGIVVDPTAGAFEGMLTQQQGQPDPGLQPIAQFCRCCGADGCALPRWTWKARSSRPTGRRTAGCSI